MFNKKKLEDLTIGMYSQSNSTKLIEHALGRADQKITKLEKRIDEAHEIIEQLLDGLGLEAIIVPEQEEHIEVELIECDCEEVKKTNKRGRPRKN